MTLLNNFWAMCVAVAPFLLLGFLLSGIFSIYLTKNFVMKHLAKDSVSSVVKATLIGIPLPLCSCSVLPLAIMLGNKKASNGAVVSFLTSTPQTGIDSILVTYSILGAFYAIIRVIVAFFTGIFSGIAVILLGKKSETKNVEIKSCCQDKETTEIKSTSCCSQKEDVINLNFLAKMKKGLTFGFGEIPQNIGKELLIGIFIAAIFMTLIPQDYFQDSQFGQGFLGMTLMLLLSVPLYVCSSASVPIAASLIIAGFSPGAVLVFLVMGPATNAMGLLAISKILGLRDTLIYLSSLIFVTYIFAGIIGFFPEISKSVQKTVSQCHGDEISTLASILAIVFLIILSLAIFRKKIKK